MRFFVTGHLWANEWNRIQSKQKRYYTSLFSFSFFLGFAAVSYWCELLPPNLSAIIPHKKKIPAVIRSSVQVNPGSSVFPWLKVEGSPSGGASRLVTPSSPYPFILWATTRVCPKTFVRQAQRDDFVKKQTKFAKPYAISNKFNVSNNFREPLKPTSESF